MLTFKTMIKNIQYDRLIVRICFILFSLCFWGMCYPFHLAYQEQFQLFLFTSDYWVSKSTYPGGISEYIAEFLTQFYYYKWLGVLIVTFLLVFVQILTHSLTLYMSRLKGTSADAWYYISYFPSVSAWVFLCDENNMLAGIISLIMTLAVTWGYICVRKIYFRWIYAFAMLPLLYWVAGGLCGLFLLWVLFCEAFVYVSSRRNFHLLFCLLLLLVAVACPYYCSSVLQYPPVRLITGIGYYRFPVGIPLAGIMVCLVSWLAVVVPLFLPPVNTGVRYRCNVLLLIIVALVGTGWIYFSCDWQKEKVIAYDYYVRTRQWNKVIAMAEKETPVTPLEVVSLNLALAKTGQLGERMFQFYQNGTAGLLPDFVRDFNVPLMVNEVYYHLGMINTAQRFTFEAMEAIPSYQKSVRCYQRLAETNIINGDYAVAGKYLRALTHTTFYRHWAEEALTCLSDEQKINAHPEWGYLRTLLYDDDFLFDEGQKDNMLGILLQKNKANKLALEYLLAYELLNKDIEAFLKYYPLGKDMGYTAIPRSYQEVLLYVWTQQHTSFKGMPWSISPVLQKEVTEFATAYVHNPADEAYFRQNFGKTYWYYLLFRGMK